MEVQALVRTFGLKPHPEGGFYAETYRSELTCPRAALPAAFSGDRAFSTGIFFLLPPGVISKFHRIQSDEMWHFYSGGPLQLSIIDKGGKLLQPVLGSDFARGQYFQYVVPAGCWFGAKPASDKCSFVGCTVSPGFDFREFELARREELMAMFPQQELKSVITELTS